MKHHFIIEEEQEAPFSIIVGAFLDCEHYSSLHSRIIVKQEVVWAEKLRIRYQQTLSWLGLRMTQRFTMEYVPPGTFLSYDIEAFPKWYPSIHHFIATRVKVHYKPHPEHRTTVMRVDVNMEIPLWLYPFRHLLQTQFVKLHHQKDEEDLAAIRRRAELFGYENDSAYFAPHQFLLFKDSYVEYFGKSKLSANSQGESVHSEHHPVSSVPMLFETHATTNLV